MATAFGAQPLELLSLVPVPPRSYQLRVRIACRPRPSTLSPRDGEALLRQVRTGDVIRQIRCREDKRTVSELKH